MFFTLKVKDTCTLKIVSELEIIQCQETPKLSKKSGNLISLLILRDFGPTLSSLTQLGRSVLFFAV